MRNAIINNLQGLFRVLRTVFAGTPQLMKLINEDYEDVLYSEMKLIPIQFDKHIINVMNMIKIIIKNINFDNLTKDIEDLSLNYKGIIFHNFVSSLIDSLPVESKTKSIFKNFLTKFKPICKCVDKIIEDPIKYLKIYSNIYSDTNDLL